MPQPGPAKIAIFLPSLEGGGAERVLATLANAFAARGFDVDMVLGSAKGPFLESVGAKVRIVDLGKRRIVSSILPLRAYLRRERPAVVLSALSHANIAALIAGRLAGGRTHMVISERSSFFSCQEHYKGLKDRIIRVLMRLFYRWADAITVVSQPVVSELVNALKLDEKRIHYIPNPVVSPDLLAKAALASPHSWLDDKSRPVILGVGRLSPEKGFDTLIRAFARIVHRRPARLLILGEGPQRAHLERLAAQLGVSDLVGMPGFDKNPFAAMARATLFVLPSRFEGMPGALIQAMACGTPVVSTDCRTGPRDVLDGGRWGRLVPVADEKAMAEAIIAALEDDAPPAVQKRAALFDERPSVSHYLSVMGLEHDDRTPVISAK